VAVVALALVLFLDAVNLELTELRGDWLVIGLLAGSGMLLLELPVILALLLGTILASTDPVVLRDVLRDLRIPRSVRRTLSVEAGTNDLVVLPILLVLIAVAHADPGGVGDWLGFVAQLFVLGPAAGFAVGAVGSWVMDRVDRHFQIRREYQSLYGIGLVLGSFVAGEAVGGEGFLAAFAAGLAVTVVNQPLCDCFLVLFGALLSTIAVRNTSATASASPAVSGSCQTRSPSGRPTASATSPMLSTSPDHGSRPAPVRRCSFKAA
jgi:sodium/hydrogen antiporter